MTDETTSKPAAQLMAGASTREAAYLAMWQTFIHCNCHRALYDSLAYYVHPDQ
jgi:hypothetical protein